jgi:hypothetical protein
MLTEQDILALCDRYERYLLPIEAYILRQRYNGRVEKSTYTVGREMGLSDETIRLIENRALALLAEYIQAESTGQAIYPRRVAKAFRQPTARLICQGKLQAVSINWRLVHRGELLIRATIPGCPGALIGRAILEDCRGRGPKHHLREPSTLYFTRAEYFPKPIPCKYGSSSLFYIDPATAQQLPPRYEYRITVFTHH